MRIQSDMDLNELIALMGERHGVDRTPDYRYASLKEAADLRNLLVRDFAGKDTDEVPGLRWHAMCCAVDPLEQTD